MSELLPCPFCGSNAIERAHAIAVEVICLGCGAGVLANEQAAAVNLWNTRFFGHTPDAQGAMIVLHQSPAVYRATPRVGDNESASMPDDGKKRRRHY